MANERRLIDANKLVGRKTNLLFPSNMEPCGHIPGTVEAVLVDEIYAMPTVAAVEVVRCKDCAYYGKESGLDIERRCGFFSGAYDHGYPTEPDDFCSHGERKSNG